MSPTSTPSAPRRLASWPRRVRSPRGGSPIGPLWPSRRALEPRRRSSPATTPGSPETRPPSRATRRRSPPGCMRSSAPPDPRGGLNAVVALPTGWLRSHQAELVREDHGLDAVAQVELGENATDVGLHGRLGEDEALGDLRVRPPRRQLEQHLALAGGEFLQAWVLRRGARGLV